MRHSHQDQENLSSRQSRVRSARAALEVWVGEWSAADTSHVVLGLVTAFLLLASPLVPYLFTTFSDLLAWTCLIGIPLGIVGVVMDHRVARHS